MNKIEGSLTVEAAIVCPLLLLLFGIAMNGGIELYKEVKNTAISITQEKKEDIIRTFYQWEMLGDVIKHED